MGGAAGFAVAGPAGAPVGAFICGVTGGITAGALSEVGVEKLEEAEAVPQYDFAALQAPARALGQN